MDLKEFERQILAGEITDFEPYFEDKDINYHLRYILAKLGIEVDRIIEMDGPGTILGFIKDKVHTDRYEEWKNHPHASVLQALAQNGYFLDYLINNENEDIRRQIIEKDLRLGLPRLNNEKDRLVVKRILEKQTNNELELDILKAYIEAEEEYGDIKEPYLYPAFKLKYEAMSSTPTTIEKTMSPAQLYTSNSPLWALNYTIDKIRRIRIPLQGKLKTKENFNNAVEITNNWREKKAYKQKTHVTN